MTQKEIKCPTCGRLTFYSLENPNRPFCSDRCKLIDLGDWASESYKIPVKGSESSLTEFDLEELEKAGHKNSENE